VSIHPNPRSALYSLKDLLVDKKKGIEVLANQYNKIGKGQVSMKYNQKISEVSAISDSAQ